MKEHYYIGVDLGQARDHSAIAVLESSETVINAPDPVTAAYPRVEHLILRQLERIRLGTEYTAVAARVAQVARGLDVSWAAPRVTVVVDATGTGRPVVETIRKAGMRAQVVPVIITGGQKANYSGGFWTVGKGELMTKLCVMVEKGELTFANDLDGRQILVEEMAGMKRSSVFGGPCAIGKFTNPV